MAKLQQLEIAYDGASRLLADELQKLHQAFQSSALILTDMRKSITMPAAPSGVPGDWNVELHGRVNGGRWIKGEALLLALYEVFGLKVLSELGQLPEVQSRLKGVYSGSQRIRTPLSSRGQGSDNSTGLSRSNNMIYPTDTVDL